MEYFDDDGAGSSNSANNAIPPPASGAGHFEDPGFLGGYSATPGANFYPPNVFQRTVREEHLKLQFSNEFLISTEPRRRGDQLDAMTMPHFQKYEKIGHPIGEGTYGTVWKAKLKDAAKALMGMEEQASTSDFFPDDVAATTSSALKKRRLAAFDGAEDATAASEVDEPPHEDVLAEEDGHDPEDERAPEREHLERLFALKKVNLRNEKEGFPLSAIREIRLLKRLKHPNIVALRDLIWTPQERANKFRGVVHLVFEFVEHDLTGLLIYRKRMFHLSEVKNMATQILTGLNFLHQHEIMHRDLKLSNVLVSNDGVLKIADFGLSRYCEDPGLSAIAVLPPVEFQEVESQGSVAAPLAASRSGASSPAMIHRSNARNYEQRAADDPERPQHLPGHSSSNAAGSATAAAVPPSVVGAQFTNRVITLWYRPPELLLGCKVYGKEVDIWSVGCVIGELILGRPLFPLDNEKKVYQRIAEFCGKPTPDTWPDLFFKKASVFPHRQAFGVEMGLARGCQTADERMFQMEEDDEDDFGVPVDGVEEGDEDFNEYETPFEELFGKVVVVDQVVVDGDHVGHATTGSTGGGRSATKGSFMASMLAMDPSRRKSCPQILSHAFLRTEPPLACRNEEIKVNKKLNLHEMQAVKVRDKDKKMREAREELNRRKLRGGTAGGRWE